MIEEKKGIGGGSAEEGGVSQNKDNFVIMVQADWEEQRGFRLFQIQQEVFVLVCGDVSVVFLLLVQQEVFVLTKTSFSSTGGVWGCLCCVFADKQDQ